MSWKFVLSLILALIVAVFAIQNAEPVTVNLLFKKAYVSQALIILISAISGALAVAFLGLANQMKLKSTIKNNNKTILSLEEENRIMEAKLESALKASEPTSEVTGNNMEKEETVGVI